MFAAPPIVNLIALKSVDIYRASGFYLMAFGMAFVLERHGDGPEHYSYTSNGVVLKLYPLAAGEESTSATRIGLSVDSVDELVPLAREEGAEIIKAPHDSASGRRAVPAVRYASVIREPDARVVILCSYSTHFFRKDAPGRQQGGSRPGRRP